ncbi:hypothetical protein VB711_15545 [Cronbergia sp. UHCC 0137]|uniref:hypothetical protein n=1 Tax=Cronbergia sp. UHCC 0137 TaxID=3110239 RepID=UPI002B214DFF|nr:hypothetical protein [Cronbergia sp. UHCC 0137]MEA5619241.1 hypothetical protein [Cronbergia sp. UHCC 0137]
MIIDLFSHKIHSSSDEWVEKLAELATIFGEFDGRLYNRATFESRLQRISPRASYLTQEVSKLPYSQGGRLDVSKFRDEISAYPAYLGLYFLEKSVSGWVVRVSETTKRFLLREEPDVASFLRLQLPLFQYPNAMGAVYKSHSNDLRIQANTKERTLGFIEQGIHFSPVRLMSVALKADAQLRDVEIFRATVTFQEIFGLANSPIVNQQALPNVENVIEVLDSIRQGNTLVPRRYESRFHTLRHTEMFDIHKRSIKLRDSVNEADRDQLIKRLEAICSIDCQFNDFDNCTTDQDIKNVIASSAWGKYFDGVMSLPSQIVEVLTDDKVLESNKIPEPIEFGEMEAIPQPVAEIYPFRDRTRLLPPVKPYNRQSEIADPELTKIKRQRRNLIHKELVDKMDFWLRNIGAQPKENDHIDLVAKIPSDGSFIFEMKSGGESLLEQIRKGISQLYEYKYRYKSVINDDHISLCLVLPESPDSIPWITEYVCNDRKINICWFNDNGDLSWPSICSEQMKVLERQ